MTGYIITVTHWSQSMATPGFIIPISKSITHLGISSILMYLVYEGTWILQMCCVASKSPGSSRTLFCTYSVTDWSVLHSLYCLSLAPAELLSKFTDSEIWHIYMVFFTLFYLSLVAMNILKYNSHTKPFNISRKTYEFWSIQFQLSSSTVAESWVRPPRLCSWTSCLKTWVHPYEWSFQVH